MLTDRQTGGRDAASGRVTRSAAVIAISTGAVTDVTSLCAWDSVTGSVSASLVTAGEMCNRVRCCCF